MSPSLTATFCATLVDEWVRAGVSHAVIAPGSRSTPLALALVAEHRLVVQVVHDERSASFLALGIGAASGVPAVLLCTSGTAAAEFHAAVIEADLAEVPMLVCTADRPPELRDVGAPQTIDQTHLFGRAVRWFVDPGPPDSAGVAAWRSIAARAVIEATGARPGPVHVNLPFREPLVGEPGELPPGRSGGRPWHEAARGDGGGVAAAVERLAPVVSSRNGVIVAGAGAGAPAAVHGLAARLGWPVLADPRSGCRLDRPTTIAAFDTLLRGEQFKAQHHPDVVVQLGAVPASKVLTQWLGGLGAGVTRVVAGRSTAWADPDRAADLKLEIDPAPLCTALAAGAAPAAPGWLSSWAEAEALAQRAIDDTLARRRWPTEPGIAREVLRRIPAGGTLVVSSSMPVRDLEWFGAPRDDVTIVANRGANGIDGVVSTAVGAALATGGPTTLLIGDVALVHDANGLLAARRAGVDLTIVLIDNDGGGIFEFLPQAALARDRFEQLFGTPHGVDLAALARAYGVPTVDDLAAAAALTGGCRLVRLTTDRTDNVAVHAALNAAVAEAVGGRGGQAEAAGAAG